MGQGIERAVRALTNEETLLTGTHILLKAVPFAVPSDPPKISIESLCSIL